MEKRNREKVECWKFGTGRQINHLLKNREIELDKLENESEVCFFSFDDSFVRLWPQQQETTHFEKRLVGDLLLHIWSSHWRKQIKRNKEKC